MIARLSALSELIRLHEVYWAEIGEHLTTRSIEGRNLKSFFLHAWDPWYTRFVMTLTHDLTRAQEIQLADNAEGQFAQLRELARSQYHVPVPETGDVAKYVGDYVAAHGGHA